jgi:hypothetical protein
MPFPRTLRRRLNPTAVAAAHHSMEKRYKDLSKRGRLSHAEFIEFRNLSLTLNKAEVSYVH